MEIWLKRAQICECFLFRSLNNRFHRKWLNGYFRFITHLGGAAVSISVCLLLLFLPFETLKAASLASALALALSHIPVALLKKLYPRKRPYLQIINSYVLQNPLRDHSFPSGHTTAIFAISTPFIISFSALSLLLLPLSLSVALSRIYLGLHYPSDVAAGMLIGSSFGYGCFSFFLQIMIFHWRD